MFHLSLIKAGRNKSITTARKSISKLMKLQNLAAKCAKIREIRSCEVGTHVVCRNFNTFSAGNGYPNNFRLKQHTNDKHLHNTDQRIQNRNIQFRCFMNNRWRISRLKTVQRTNIDVLYPSILAIFGFTFWTRVLTPHI